MASEPPSGEENRHALTGKYLVPLIVVIMLSLATWSFFYLKQMALTPADTSFVVGFWLLVVFAVRWTFARIGRSKGKMADGKNS